jgi:hypothetical protein
MFPDNSVMTATIFLIIKSSNTISISKDNEAARRRRRKRIVPYVEEADDDTNKVSQRK